MKNIIANEPVNKYLAKVISVRHLNESTYVLRISRSKFFFQAGQYIVLGLPNTNERREYSIYSSVNELYIELLIKEVDNGLVSHSLSNLKAGDFVEVEGPFGYFVLDERKLQDRKFLFIASGTGISPFHSMILSYNNLNYTLLHGVRSGNESYDNDVYMQGCYVQCTSRDALGNFSGRVTDYLKLHKVLENIWVYVCGNNAMIDDVYAILEQQGVPSNLIHAEVYF